MKQTKLLITILILTLFVYLFVVNVIYNNNLQDFIISNLSDNGTLIMNYGGTEKIDMGDSVQVQITRNRWYGTINEGGGKSILYLFKFIPLPLEKSGNDYLTAHIIFSCLWWLLLTIILIFHFALKEEMNESSEQKNI